MRCWGCPVVNSEDCYPWHCPVLSSGLPGAQSLHSEWSEDPIRLGAPVALPRVAGAGLWPVWHPHGEAAVIVLLMDVAWLMQVAWMAWPGQRGVVREVGTAWLACTDTGGWVAWPECCDVGGAGWHGDHGGHVSWVLSGHSTPTSLSRLLPSAQT